MTQEEFGRQIGLLLGKAWSRSTVSVAENGKRAFTAAELVAIAHVLDTSASRLFMPPAGVREISMPSGATLPARDLPITRFPEDLNRAAITETIDALAKIADRSQEDAARIREEAARREEDAARTKGLVEDLDRLFMWRIAAGGVIRSPLAGPGVDPSPPEYYPAEQHPNQEDPLPSVVAAIVTSEFGVLIGRRNDGKPPWTFIAGEQDAVQDESPADTAVREVKEETGLEVTAGGVIGERDHPRTGRHMIYMAARPVRDTDVFVGDSEELAEVRWVSLAELDELMGAGNVFAPVHEHLQRELGA
jgi:8-oxo-dGTP diphosphatase